MRIALPDPLPHPEDAVTLDLKGYSQIDTQSCGAVAGYSVVSSFYPNVKFERFYERCRVDPEVGVTMANLKDALERSGITVDYRRKLTFSRLSEWIDGGYPVICNIHREPDEFGIRASHWLVLYGYRSKPREVFASGNGWGAVAGGLFSLVGQHRIDWRHFLKTFNTSRGHQGHAFVCSAHGRTLSRA